MAASAPEYFRVDGAGGPGLELRIAGAGARAYAFVLDLHFRFVAALLMLPVTTRLVDGRWWPDFTTPGDDAQSRAFFMLVPAMLVYLLYHPVLEWWLGGATPGKRIAGVGLVTREGLPPGLLAILTRNVFRLVDSLPFMYVVGLLCAIFTREQVRLGDLVAGTVLVYQRPPRRADRERFAALLAEGELPVAFREVARDLLDRWPALDPAARSRLARDLLAGAGRPPAADAPDADLQAALAAVAGDGR